MIFPVIKADAYGHGAVEVAEYLKTVETAQNLTFSVAICEEAISLRNAGITNPILVFENLSAQNIIEHLKYNLIGTIADEEGLQVWKNSNGGGEANQKVSIKFDTGMGRLGFTFDSISAIAEFLTAFKPGSLHSVYTHFSSADESDLNYTHGQIARYLKIIQFLKEKGIDPGCLHHSNSAGILALDDNLTNAVRLGISLYGYYPSDFVSKTVPLIPVMSLISEVATIRYFEEGEYVSYGRKFKVAKRSKIATLPVGYADGIPRILSGKISVTSGGEVFPQIGTITMDRIMIDCSDSNINKNDEMTLFGSDFVSADHWARLAGTISYEITCGISGRVPRKYVK